MLISESRITISITFFDYGLKYKSLPFSVVPNLFFTLYSPGTGYLLFLASFACPGLCVFFYYFDDRTLIFITQLTTSSHPRSHNPTKMRRDKTFTRILLIFSIANVVLAGPALVRQRRLVTGRSESDSESDSADESRPLLDKALDSYSASKSSNSFGSVAQAAPPSPAGPGLSDQESSSESKPLLDKALDSYSASQSSNTFGSVAQAAPPSPAGPGSLDQESSSESKPLLDKAIDDYHASQSSTTLGSVAKAPPPSPAGPGSLDQGSASGSGTAELHLAPPPYVPPFTSGNRDPPSQLTAPPEVEMQPMHGNQPPLPDDAHPSWHDWKPSTEIEEVEEPVVHNVPDVNKEEDHYWDIDEMKKNLITQNAVEKPVTFCDYHCGEGYLDRLWASFKLPSIFDESSWQHIPRSFEWSPERDRGHRFF